MKLSDFSRAPFIRPRSTAPVHHLRAVAAGVLLTTLGLVLAACSGGASAKTSPTTTTSTTVDRGAALQAFRTCLQQHGVTLPTPPTTTPGETRPSRGTGGFLFGDGANDPATRAAVQACQSKLPAGFVQRQQQRQQQFAAFVSCMKDNGVTITTVQGGPGGGLGSIDRTSAAYQKCSVLLPTFAPRSSTTTTP